MLGSCYVKSDLSDRYRDSFSNKLTWYSLDVICRAHGSPRQILTNSARRLIKIVATLMKFRSFIKSWIYKSNTQLIDSKTHHSYEITQIESYRKQ